MEEDFIFNSYETRINVANEKFITERYELVKLKCTHCDCSTNREGFKIKRYRDGILNEEFLISAPALLALVGPRSQ